MVLYNQQPKEDNFSNHQFFALNNYTHTFDTAAPLDIVANITGFAGNQGGFHLLIPNDPGIATCTNPPTGIPVSGNALMFINEVDIPNAVLYELTTPNTGTSGYDFMINPRELSEARTMTLTFIHIATGAWASAQITVKANKDTRRRVNSAATKG